MPCVIQGLAAPCSCTIASASKTCVYIDNNTQRLSRVFTLCWNQVRITGGWSEIAVYNTGLMDRKLEGAKRDPAGLEVSVATNWQIREDSLELRQSGICGAPAGKRVCGTCCSSTSTKALWYSPEAPTNPYRDVISPATSPSQAGDIQALPCLRPCYLQGPPHGCCTNYYFSANRKKVDQHLELIEKPLATLPRAERTTTNQDAKDSRENQEADCQEEERDHRCSARVLPRLQEASQGSSAR